MSKWGWCRRQAKFWFCYRSTRGITLHMTGYAPAYTRSLVFLTYNVADVLCKKGIFFATNRILGVPKWVKLFCCLGLQTRSENSTLKIYVKLSKRHDIWALSLSEIKRMKCDPSSPLFQWKLQKRLSVNTKIKCMLRYQIWHHLHKYTFKDIGFLWLKPFRGGKFDGVRYAI